jgi:hypothetical protein
MRITRLLARLRDEASVFIAEERKLPDRTVVYILGAHLAFYPMAPRNVWYALVSNPELDFIEEEEVEAILRRFWHSEIDVRKWIEQDLDRPM